MSLMTGLKTFMANNRLHRAKTIAQKRRLLQGFEDDTLVRFLIEIVQDINVVHYEGERLDIEETIREILIRMNQGSEVK